MKANAIAIHGLLWMKPFWHDGYWQKWNSMRGFLAFIIVFILGLGCVGSNLQHIQPTEDKTHPGLDHFYPLESVSRVTLQNWKGEHILTGGEAKRFVKLLKEFHYDGNY